MHRVRQSHGVQALRRRARDKPATLPSVQDVGQELEVTHSSIYSWVQYGFLLEAGELLGTPWEVRPVHGHWEHVCMSVWAAVAPHTNVGSDFVASSRLSSPTWRLLPTTGIVVVFLFLE